MDYGSGYMGSHAGIKFTTSFLRSCDTHLIFLGNFTLQEYACVSSFSSLSSIPSSSLHTLSTCSRHLHQLFLQREVERLQWRDLLSGLNQLPHEGGILVCKTLELCWAGLQLTACILVRRTDKLMTTINAKLLSCIFFVLYYITSRISYFIGWIAESLLYCMYVHYWCLRTSQRNKCCEIK